MDVPVLTLFTNKGSNKRKVILTQSTGRWLTVVSKKSSVVKYLSPKLIINKTRCYFLKTFCAIKTKLWNLPHLKLWGLIVNTKFERLKDSSAMTCFPLFLVQNFVPLPQYNRKSQDNYKNKTVIRNIHIDNEFWPMPELSNNKKNHNFI